jgi:hypothetical protein
MITDAAVRDAAPKGNGVFALRSFRKGEFIFRRRHGPVVSPGQVSRSIPRQGPVGGLRMPVYQRPIASAMSRRASAT